MFERIARCPVCKKQIDVLTSPTKETSGYGEALILGDSRRAHAVESPQCVGAKGWERGWDLDDFVEVPDPPKAKMTPKQYHRGKLHITWEYVIPKEISNTTVDALDIAAQSRALAMLNDGYREGELCEVVDGVEYRGWWRNQAT